MRCAMRSDPESEASRPETRKGLAALGIALTLWASAFPGIRAALVGYRPGELALCRFLVGSIVLAAAAPFARIRLPALRDVPRLVAVGATGMTAYHLALNYGETHVAAGAAAFLVNTTPIWTALAASVFLGEQLSPKGWLGFGVSFAGSVVIAVGAGAGYSLNAWAGLILIAAICQAAFFVLQKPLLRTYRPIEVTSYALWIGTALAMRFAPGLAIAMRAAPLSATLAAVYLGVFPTALGYLTWALVLSQLSAQRAGSLLYIVPVLAVIIAWIWLGERPSAITLIGGAMALAGVKTALKESHAPRDLLPDGQVPIGETRQR
jgi:drug/metabolite transporter (DMT)-like permease